MLIYFSLAAWFTTESDYLILTLQACSNHAVNIAPSHRQYTLMVFPQNALCYYKGATEMQDQIIFRGAL